MITKEKFVAIIKEIESLEKDIEDIHIALKKLDPDFNGFYLTRLLTLILDILESTLNDDDSWIEYFVYELNFGKKWKEGTITQNGKGIKIQTAENLYDFLMMNNNEKSKLRDLLIRIERLENRNRRIGRIR